MNKDSLVGSFLPQLLWQQDMTLQFCCHTADGRRAAGADADDEDPVISRSHKCDTLFTTGSSQTEELLVSVDHHSTFVEQDMKQEWDFKSASSATECENLKFTPQRFGDGTTTS